jgi:hypothetical protein
MNGQCNLYWLSFVRAEGNAGCCIVEAVSAIDAAKQSHRLGINPGGSVLICEIETLGPFEKNRLYSKQECSELGTIADAKIKWR